MPELTATQFMTENLTFWLQGHSITNIAFSRSANRNRIMLGGFPTPSPPCGPAWRRGKHSVVPIGDGALIFSYNLSGKVLCSDAPETALSGAAASRLAFKISNDSYVLWKDRINLGEVHWFPQRGPNDAIVHAFFQKTKKLGPEFWPEHRNGAWWSTLLGTRKSRLYTLLMNQQIVAGIGNIISLETLHRLKVPLTIKSNALSAHQWSDLASAVRTVVSKSLEQHALLRRQESSQMLRGELKLVAEGHTHAKGFLIYGRAGETCPSCSTGSIQKGKLSGRPTYWCPICQRH